MGLQVYHCSSDEESFTEAELRKKLDIAEDKEIKDDDTFSCPDHKKAKIKDIKPARSYDFKYEEWQAGVEKFYFFLLDELRKKGYKVEKLTDTYTSSEASEFFGLMEQRKGMAVDKVMQYMATIGSLVKQLFQLVRELTNLDERLEYYKSYHDKEDKDFDAKDISLKGIWVDRVEGGAQKPTSIYGMAMQLGFTTLPDLFFATKVRDGENVSEVIAKQEKEGFNRKVLEVLKRKLEEFNLWRTRTEKELLSGRSFRLYYLRQHFRVIQLYLSWVKPYLRNVGRMSMYAPEEQKNKAAWAEIIGASQSAVIDLELFGVKKVDPWKPPKSRYSDMSGVHNTGMFHKCIRITFHHRTRPQLVYTREYQKGPIQVGITDITFEAYVMTDDDIKKFKQQKAEEDMEILKNVYGSIEAMYDHLQAYLEEAGDKFEIPEKEKEKKEAEKKKKEAEKGTLAKMLDSWNKTKESMGKLKPKPKKQRPPQYMIDKDKKELAKNVSEELYKFYEGMRKNFDLVTK